MKWPQARTYDPLGGDSHEVMFTRPAELARKLIEAAHD
jgi:hypothetical protein